MASSDPDWGGLVDTALGIDSPTVTGALWRIVESQSQVATLALVDSLAEQAVLEELIEASKPSRPPGTERLHYLLATPFRYPPLHWGSRFGGRHEPSIFYGSRSISTALAEAAYYRFLFWQGMEAPPPGGVLRTRHDVFSARYRADPGLALHRAPFAAYQHRLTSRRRYTDTQDLGAAMRERGVRGFEFTSARYPEHGINVGLFDPAALVSVRPLEVRRWICETRADAVLFRETGKPLYFPLALFEVDGKLPAPA